MKGVDKLYDLERITTNLLHGKKVYTEGEVIDILQNTMLQVNPMVTYKEEFYQKLLEV